MDKLAKLVTDIGRLWENYSGAYFTGIQNTLILAVAAWTSRPLLGTQALGDWAQWPCC